MDFEKLALFKTTHACVMLLNGNMHRILEEIWKNIILVAHGQK